MPPSNLRQMLRLQPEKCFESAPNVEPEPKAMAISQLCTARSTDPTSHRHLSFPATQTRRLSRWRPSLLLLLVSMSVLWWSPTSATAWQENLRPKLFVSPMSSTRDFTQFSGRGNATNPDYFSTMLYTTWADDGDDSEAQPVLLLGAVNTVYKLLPSSSELKLLQTLVWPSSDFDRESCLVKGKDKSACQNYIKVLLRYPSLSSSTSSPVLAVCGTNAFKPMCRDYVDERGAFEMRSERSGLGLAPFDPAHNSTAVLAGDVMYAATVADFTGVDPIVFREPLRTQQYDSMHLNSPDFVGSMEHEDLVYFFFREEAVEHINCGRGVFSRVARVCKNDQGGPGKSKYSWTSFLKARLNCSVPGEFPFYFDEIQDVTPLVRGSYGGTDSDQIVYATFSTAVNSIGGSAVCAFRLKDISDAFSGRFKEQKSMSANWLPVEEHKVPNPRPGICVNDTKQLSDANLNFLKTHLLMDESVAPFFGAPVLIRTSGFVTSRFSAIAVDPQVATTDGKAYDVIFVGTTNGRVLKVINAQSADSSSGVSTVVIEELQVFPADTVVSKMSLLGSGQRRQSLGQLAVMSSWALRSLPVQRCDRAATCADCVALQDPYCAWEVKAARCSSGDWTKNMGSSFLQSVATGTHAKCGGGAAKAAPADALALERQLNSMRLGQVVNIVDESAANAAATNAPGTDRNAAQNAGGSFTANDGGPGKVPVVDSSQTFTLETLIITVSAGAVAALVVGFVSGYCCGRRCRKDDDGVTGASRLMLPYGGDEYEYFEHRGNGNNLARPVLVGPAAPLLPNHMQQPQVKFVDAHHNEEVMYAEPELVTGLRPSMVSGGPQMMPMGGLLPMGGLAPAPPPARFPMPSSDPNNPDGLLPGHYSSSLLTPQAKFNTLHAGRALPSINQYESAAEARLGSGKDPSFYARGRDNLNSYHMSTLGRSSSMRTGPKDPLAAESSSGGSSGSNDAKGHQVVDSAYGTTTRSAKKVYL